MACFLVPAAEAVVVKVAEKVAKSKEEKVLTEGTKIASDKPARRGCAPSFRACMARRDYSLVPVPDGDVFTGGHDGNAA